METFVSRTLTKITKAAKGVAKFKELRAACDEALEKLAAAKAAGENGEDAEAYFAPLRLACESQHASLNWCGCALNWNEWTVPPALLSLL